MDRVVVFLDYQNVYQGARNAYMRPEDDPTTVHGQVDPLSLAHLIVGKRKHQSQLDEVRVYRGQPDSKKDPRGYGANRAQAAAWQQRGRTTVILRPLRYPPGWPDDSEPGEKPQEKGIDVALAIDFVMMAVERRFDVGVVMSTDTDLKPPLEAVTRLNGINSIPRAEVAAWAVPGEEHSRRLSIDMKQLWCHWLDETDYRKVADPTDYVRRR